MCILMGERLAIFLTVFLYVIVFGVKGKNRCFFKEKNGFESSFYKIDI